MNRIGTGIMFDGHEMFIIPSEPDYILLCKGVRGFLVQAKQFLQQSSPTGDYFFGKRLVEKDHNGNVRVDCLSDKRKAIEEVVEFCKQHKENERQQRQKER